MANEMTNEAMQPNNQPTYQQHDRLNDTQTNQPGNKMTGPTN